MNNFMTHIVSITILLFLIITFLQSSIDKIVDWKGNISWLTGHFAKTFLRRTVPILLGIVLLMELVTSILCILGVYELIADNHIRYAAEGMFSACFTLLLLLFGQRVAKDYQGALTITCYFIVAVFGLYVVTS